MIGPSLSWPLLGCLTCTVHLSAVDSRLKCRSSLTRLVTVGRTGLDSGEDEEELDESATELGELRMRLGEVTRLPGAPEVRARFAAWSIMLFVGGIRGVPSLYEEKSALSGKSRHLARKSTHRKKVSTRVKKSAPMCV